MLEDIASYGLEIHFACLSKYFPIMENHPYIKSLIPYDSSLNRWEYGQYYDTSTTCRVHETRMAPHCIDHRSDIWAATVGVRLNNHNMHFPSIAKTSGNRVVFVPISSGMPEKDLTTSQITETVSGLRRMGYTVVGLHTHNQKIFTDLGVEQVITQDMNLWMKTINECNCVITVDTAAFHYAGGIGKPLVGIFGFTKGVVYGKYYLNTMIVQGLCPFEREGCYNVTLCPKNKNETIPCKQNLMVKEILEAFSNLIIRFPYIIYTSHKENKLIRTPLHLIN